MAYWHNPDGSPAKPFRGEFDWSHVPALFVSIILPVALIALAWCRHE